MMGCQYEFFYCIIVEGVDIYVVFVGLQVDWMFGVVVQGKVFLFFWIYDIQQSGMVFIQV